MSRNVKHVLFILSVLVLLLAATDGEAGFCIANERRALLSFKAMILWDPLDFVSTWGTKMEDVDDENDCCNWKGVTCSNEEGDDCNTFGVTCINENSHVTRLDLGMCGLKGEISPSLLNLTHLTDLSLRGNSFNGTIPRWIGYLTELSHLELADNSFSGPIPQELGNLSNLKTLWLDDIGKNCTVENINWLSRLSHLESLNMNGISLARANHWVNAILSLQNLTDLNLERCNLSQVMLPYSSTLSVNSSSNTSNIYSIYLRDNNLNSSMYTWLFPLTGSRLSILALSGNKLDGIPKYFGKLCGLEYLDFTNNSALVTFSDFLKSLSAGCTSDMLTMLEASSSQFTGSIPNDIQKFSTLQTLVLDHNQLNGTISEKMWDLPELSRLDVSFNSLKGAVFEKTGISQPKYLDLSNNLFQFQGVPSEANMSILSYVEHLDLSSCRLGPHFPIWIPTSRILTSIHYLNIANSGISGTIPLEFLNMLNYSQYLNLSSNNISGEVPDLFSSTYISALDLSSNNFYGPIMNVSSRIHILNLSKNKFYGGIYFLCQLVGTYGVTTHIDLSYNSFSGQIPDCLLQLKELRVLNLAHNDLSGRIPTSVEYWIQLEVLYLYSNQFSGELPLSLSNCSMLTFLDLGCNRFSGSLPVWIGDNLSRLYVLSLGSNNFIGTIPLQFCQLVNLQVLDLSMNNLNGTIPSCISNLTSMLHEEFLSTANVHRYGVPTYGRSMKDYDYVDQAMIRWQGIRREFTNNLRLLKSIDLSSNNLTGKIPNELTDLRGLLALNLSKNALLGEIPQAIGHMKQLIILDLSRNNCSGAIPSSMSQMTSLSDLDVSYNNLSGRIPSSTQLRSFNSSRYIGNAGLCGLPLSNYCPGDKTLPVPSPVAEREGGDQGDIDELERWFYIGGAIGFATGFWIMCITFLVISRGRRKFFHFMDTLENRVDVKVLEAIFQKKAQE